MINRSTIMGIAMILILIIAISCFTGAWRAPSKESLQDAVPASSAALSGSAQVDSGCLQTAAAFNRMLPEKIDEAELAAILTALDRSGNRELPEKFVTKAQARKAGWKPGDSLWSHRALKGKSIGGDRFMNREKKLPAGSRSWRELDLDYRGGPRGAKRMVFSGDGMRFVTVDHYRTFYEVPPCP